MPRSGPGGLRTSRGVLAFRGLRGTARFVRVRALGFGILLACALLLFVEGVARLFPHEDRDGPRTGLVDADPDLVWRLRPVPSGPGKTNELGFRDTPYRPQADVKVLVLGDSVSWGDSVGDVHQVFPQRLERLLESRMPGRIVEVVNAGVPGYSTFQERRYLERDGLALSPDLIVLQFCLNDLVEPYLSIAEYGGDNYFLGIDTREALHGVFGMLVRRSRAVEAFARALQTRGRRALAFQVEKLTHVPLSHELQGAWADITGEIDRIQARARAHRIPLLLLIVPYRFQLADPQGLRQPQDYLIAHARRAGLPHVDLLPHLVHASTGSDEPMLLDASHLSAEGHAVAARVLAERIIAMLAASTDDAV